METIELSGRTGQEVYEELKHRLEGMGYLPDEYFLLDDVWEDGKVVPGMRISSAPRTTEPARASTWTCA